ncbi:MAG: MarR family transcriptional regulator [Pseudobdellovibrio sp.]
MQKKQDFLDLFTGLSRQRLELIWEIKQANPSSVYELSKLLNKSQPYLQKEINFLESKGLITLKKNKVNGRHRVKPEVIYQILAIEVDFSMGDSRKSSAKA